MGILDAPGLAPSTADRKFARNGTIPARVMRRAPTNRAASGWSIPAQANADAASTPDYTADAFYGNRCLRLVSLGTAAQIYAVRTMNTIFDAANCDVRITIKVTDYDFTSISVIVGTSNLSNFSTATLAFTAGGASAPGSPLQKDRWVQITIPQSKFSGNVNWSTIQLVRIGISDVNGSPTELRVHSIDFVHQNPVGRNPNGIVVLTADDSHVTQYTVLRPALAARGWRATLMPIPGLHGTDDTQFLTDAQVIDLHDNYGWEVGAHCWDSSSHAIGLAALTSDQRLAEFREVRAWQAALGFNSLSHSHPLGTRDAATEADVAKFWRASRLANSIGGMNETTSPAQPYALQAENIVQGATYIGAQAVKAHNDNGVLFVMMHQILASGGDANTVTPTVLTAVLDAIAASGCDVLTMGEALDRMGL